MPRPLLLACGLFSYAIAVGSMVAFAPFLADSILPRTVDTGPEAAFGPALGGDLALLLGFALVHSLLARRAVKNAVARALPAGLERAAYSSIAGLQMGALLLFWRPLPGVVWSVAAPAGRLALRALFALGCAVIVAGFLALRHDHLFGLAQARAAARGEPYVEPPLQVRGIYRHLRHPLYAGTLILLWATPAMSAGHLLLAGVFTLYILVGYRLEERDLLREHGAAFDAYRAAVPGFLPRSPAPRHPEKGSP